MTDAAEGLTACGLLRAVNPIEPFSGLFFKHIAVKQFPSTMSIGQRVGESTLLVAKPLIYRAVQLLLTLKQPLHSLHHAVAYAFVL